jgi:hypothetical protein
MASGKARMELPTSVSGLSPEQKDMAFTFGRRETSMKESGRTKSNMDKGQKLSLTGMSSQVGMRMVGLKEKDLTNGQMVQTTSEILKMD